MRTNQTDIELIYKVLHENNAQAFSILMKRYSPQVYRAAIRLMKDEDNAAEVVQLAFIQAYKQLSSWRGDSFGAWVTIIANHIALRMLEKEKRRAEVAWNADIPVRTNIGYETLNENIADLPDEGYDEQKEQRLQSLEEAIGKLPEEERKIVQLHYYDGVPLAKIAGQLGQTENNIKVRLYRIREKLKKMMNYDTNN